MAAVMGITDTQAAVAIAVVAVQLLNTFLLLRIQNAVLTSERKVLTEVDGKLDKRLDQYALDKVCQLRHRSETA
jgi:hypothetical protein